MVAGALSSFLEVGSLSMSHLDDCLENYRNARAVAEKAQAHWDTFLATEPIGAAGPRVIDFNELVKADSALTDAESKEQAARAALYGAMKASP